MRYGLATLFVVMLILADRGGAAWAQTATPLATPTAPIATPTAIAAVAINFTDITTNTQTLISDMVATGDATNPLHTLVWAWAGMVIGFFVFAFVYALADQRLWSD